MKETHHNIIEELRLHRELEEPVNELLGWLDTHHNPNKSVTMPNSITTTLTMKAQRVKEKLLVIKKVRMTNAIT